jgi:hypothetical protein
MPSTSGTFSAVGQTSTGIALIGSQNFAQVFPGAADGDRVTVQTRDSASGTWTDLRAAALTGTAAPMSIQGSRRIPLPGSPRTGTHLPFAPEVRLICTSLASASIAYQLTTDGGNP